MTDAYLPEDDRVDDSCESPNCGKRAEPGSAWCYQCLKEGPPSEHKPDPLEQAAVFRRVADMLRRSRSLDAEARNLAVQDAEYFEKRAEALESVEIK